MTPRRVPVGVPLPGRADLMFTQSGDGQWRIQTEKLSPRVGVKLPSVKRLFGRK